MDGSPSRNKSRQRLMIEKVIEHIDELNQPHLKLLVMHDFMWALVKGVGLQQGSYTLNQ